MDKDTAKTFFQRKGVDQLHASQRRIYNAFLSQNPSTNNSKSKLLIDGLVWTNEAKIYRGYRDRSVPEVKDKAIALRVLESLRVCVCVNLEI